MNLKTTRWEPFTIEDLFSEGSVYKVPSYNKESLITCSSTEPDAIPYVTRTEDNNGVCLFAASGGLEDIEMGNAIVIGDTTATISYQAGSFVAGEHIIALRAPWLNVYTGLFITEILKQERYRYSYGRAFKLASIKL